MARRARGIGEGKEERFEGGLPNGADRLTDPTTETLLPKASKKRKGVGRARAGGRAGGGGREGELSRWRRGGAPLREKAYLSLSLDAEPIDANEMQ